MTHRTTPKLLLAAAALALLSACSQPAVPMAQDAPAAPASERAEELRSEAGKLLEGAGAWAKEKLAEVEVPTEVTTPAGASRAGAPYDRDAFGSAWADVDGNGCGQRDDVLLRDLTRVTVDTDGCTVLAGVLADPYTASTVLFERGASQVDIDHLVPLAAAWRMGADSWTDAKREAFANDPDNLRASYMGANRSKGDKTLSEWMPENRGFHCEYATEFMAVASKYELAVSPADAAVAREAC